jgi:hypothetical protein
MSRDPFGIFVPSGIRASAVVFAATSSPTFASLLSILFVSSAETRVACMAPADAGPACAAALPDSPAPADVCAPAVSPPAATRAALAIHARVVLIVIASPQSSAHAAIALWASGAFRCECYSSGWEHVSFLKDGITTGTTRRKPQRGRSKNKKNRPRRAGNTHNCTHTVVQGETVVLVKRNRHRRFPDNDPVAANVFRFQAQPLNRALVCPDGCHAKRAAKKGGNRRQAHRGELSGNDVRSFD